MRIVRHRRSRPPTLAQAPAAEAKAAEAVDRARDVLGPEHPVTLDIRDTLASAWKALDRLGDAEALQRETIDIALRVFGEKNRTTVGGMGNLVAYLTAQEKYAEAEPWARRALSLKREMFGDEHPTTNATRVNLAGVLRKLGRLDEVEGLARETLERMSSSAEGPDRQRVRPLTLLGGILMDRGQFAAAAEFYREALALYSTAFPADYPDAAVTRSAYAQCLVHLEQFEPAEREFVAAYESLERSLGTQHSTTRQIAGQVASSYEQRGDPQRAEPFRAKAGASGR